MILIKKTKKMGRGVFVEKDIKKGTKICVNEILRVKLKKEEEILNNYVFYGDKHYDILALGNISLLNHSSNPNCYVELCLKSNLITLYALKDIKKLSQLFINYGYQPNVL